MNTSQTKPPGYDSKPFSYFEYSRPEMQAFIPAGCKRVLDVGCGQGNFGEQLKQSRGLEVWGLEPVAAAAAQAVTKLDRVLEGIFDEGADLPTASFDAIIFNDVLEHLMDPGAALRLCHKLLTPGGAVVASIPNIRYFLTQWEVLVKKQWRYEDSGILDRTHLRFFTQPTMLALFTECGYEVEKITGINAFTGGTSRKWLAYRILNGLTLNSMADMKFLQFAVVARRKNGGR